MPQHLATAWGRRRERNSRNIRWRSWEMALGRGKRVRPKAIWDGKSARRGSDGLQGREQGAPMVQGRPGGVGEAERLGGTWGPAACTQCVSAFQERLGPGSKGERGVSERAPRLPFPATPTWIQVKPGRRCSPRVADGVGCSACCQGFGPENIWAPAARADHLQAGSWLGRWPHGLCPPSVAHTDFTPSLGVTGLHGEGRCSQQPLGSTGGLSSQDCLVPPHLRQKPWVFPAHPGLPGRPGEEAVPCSLPKPCVPKAEKAPWALPMVRPLQCPRGAECGTQLMGI